jgi:YD repeat-containing protein
LHLVNPDPVADSDCGISLKSISDFTPERSAFSRETDHGNLETRTDPEGRVMTGQYDGLNRPTSRVYTDGTPAVTMCYDGQVWDETSCVAGAIEEATGKLTEVRNANSATRYSGVLIAAEARSNNSSPRRKRRRTTRPT